MQVFKDSEREIIWYSFNHEDDYKFASHLRRLDSYLNTVDKWGEHPSVQQFLGSGKPLGRHMKNMCDNIADYKLYFATNLEGRLISALITSNNDSLKFATNLENHLKFGQDEKSEFEEYLTKKQIKTILDNQYENNMYLAMNVVDPEYHGKGIGTRILQSVINNPEYFAGNEKTNFQMTIEEDNTASNRVVYKCGFRRLNPAKYSNNNHSIYYFNYREKNIENNPEELSQ